MCRWDATRYLQIAKEHLSDSVSKYLVGITKGVGKNTFFKLQCTTHKGAEHIAEKLIELSEEEDVTMKLLVAPRQDHEVQTENNAGAGAEAEATEPNDSKNQNQDDFDKALLSILKAHQMKIGSSNDKKVKIKRALTLEKKELRLAHITAGYQAIKMIRELLEASLELR